MLSLIALIQSIGLINFILRLVVSLCALFMIFVIFACGLFLLGF